jgi:hypothetical protein
MSYSGGFKDIVYADEDHAPRVLKYRIVFVDDGSPAAMHAIIQIELHLVVSFTLRGWALFRCLVREHCAKIQFIGNLLQSFVASPDGGAWL